MSTEIDLYQPRELAAATAMERAADFGTWAPKLQSAAATAREICQTEFVPAALRGKAAAVTAAILAGSEMGLGPMTSLMHIHMIDGRPSLSSEMQRGLVLGLGHHLRYREMTTTRCVVDGQRRGETDWTTVTWTIDDAKRAGLDGKQNWRKYPRRMLAARATGELCRMLFADALAGMPFSAEELEDEADDTAAGTGEPAANGRAPAARTARRRQAAGPADRPTRAAPAAASEPTGGPAPAATAPAADLPPLPGEDVADAAGEDENDIDKDAPGSVSRPQLTKLGAIFTEYGFKAAERQQRLTVASQITGRELESSSDLSLNEACTLIDTLERCGSRENLMALLVNGEKAEASDE